MGMTNTKHETRAVGRLLGLALLLMCSTAAQADNAQEMHQRQRVYQQDRQHCLSGQSQQDQASCLREAGAARQQNRAATTPPDAEQLLANSLQRCATFTGDAHQSCLARMQGQGKVYGSATEGGILRELNEPAQ
jgi:hypothetical protein